MHTDFYVNKYVKSSMLVSSDESADRKAKVSDKSVNFPNYQIDI